MLGVDLHRPEAGLHFSRVGAERHVQHIGGGMGGIGRNEQGPVPFTGGETGDRSGERRLPDTALSTKE